MPGAEVIYFKENSVCDASNAGGYLQFPGVSEEFVCFPEPESEASGAEDSSGAEESSGAESESEDANGEVWLSIVLFRITLWLHKMYIET